MKKLYLKLEDYLTNKNNANGEAGAGGDGGATPPSGEPAGTPPEGGAPPASNGEPNAEPSDWRASLSKELLENPRLKDIDSVEGLAKALVEFQDGTPNVPEAMAMPEGVPAAIGEWAVGLGLTQEQFEGVLAKQQEVYSANLEGVKAANLEGEKALYEKWGEAKDENLALANRVVAFADPDGSLELVKFLQSPESGYAFNNPVILQVFHNIGKAFKEGGALKSDTPPNDPNRKKVPKAHLKYPQQAPK